MDGSNDQMFFLLVELHADLEAESHRLIGIGFRANPTLGGGRWGSGRFLILGH